MCRCVAGRWLSGSGRFPRVGVVRLDPKGIAVGACELSAVLIAFGAGLRNHCSLVLSCYLNVLARASAKVGSDSFLHTSFLICSFEVKINYALPVVRIRNDSNNRRNISFEKINMQHKALCEYKLDQKSSFLNCSLSFLNYFFLAMTSGKYSSLWFL
jgi:hypothetical protein